MGLRDTGETGDADQGQKGSCVKPFRAEFWIVIETMRPEGVWVGEEGLLYQSREGQGSRSGRAREPGHHRSRRDLIKQRGPWRGVPRSRSRSLNQAHDFPDPVVPLCLLFPPGESTRNRDPHRKSGA